MLDRLNSAQRPLAVGVLQVRYWQHLVNEALKKNAFPVPVHVAFGHEAAAVAIGAMMTGADRLVLTHRNIAYNLVRAGALQPVYDEYMRLPGGAGAGRLGSMNLSNPGCGIVYTSSILGNNFGVACGLALGDSLAGRSAMVTVLTGDGAMEEGTFYESLALARSHGLRCLFVVENNNHALASTIEQRRCPIDLERLCGGVGVPFRRLTGNDVFAYASELSAIRREVMSAAIPFCVEIGLATMNRHAGATPGWPTDPMNVDIGRGLMIEATINDPVFALKQLVSPALYSELERDVLPPTGSP